MRLNLNNVRNAYRNAEHITVTAAFVPGTGWAACSEDTIPADATSVEVRLIVPEYRDGYIDGHREVNADFRVAELRMPDTDATIRVRGLNVANIERALDCDLTDGYDTPHGTVTFGATFADGAALSLGHLADAIDACADYNLTERFDADVSPAFAEATITRSIAAAYRSAARIRDAVAA